MKLATRRNGTRDGQLLVVSKNLSSAIPAAPVIPTLQNALDNWELAEKKLHPIYEKLNYHELSDALTFQQLEIESPLPRAYQWADASAYVNHVELVRQARGAEMPESFWHDPLIYQGGSDQFLGPYDDIPLQDESWGLDFEAEVAIIVSDTPMGVTPEEAKEHIILFLLVNDISLRNLIPGELAKGFGFFQSKPSSAFSPVAVTPNELGNAWDGRKLHLPLTTYLNNEEFGRPNAGIDMTFDFPILIAHAARTRPLTAGTIIGSGTISNRDRSVGSSCLAEKRMLEKIKSGQCTSPFLKVGDQIRMEMLDEEGNSIFGAIVQKVRDQKVRESK